MTQLDAMGPFEVLASLPGATSGSYWLQRYGWICPSKYVVVFKTVLPPCPHLPPPRAGVDWRLLAAHRNAHRGSDFYIDCLEYSHALWQQERPARAILCLDRAFGAELKGDEPSLATWPMPYAALAWILRHAPDSLFLGNPRVHFQHYADRMNEPRLEQRRWRAWACWGIARAVLPHLPGDPWHVVTEPTTDEIGGRLQIHGLPGEAKLWREHLVH